MKKKEIDLEAEYNTEKEGVEQRQIVSMKREVITGKNVDFEKMENKLVNLKRSIVSFVVRDLQEQDKQILEKLEDATMFDELASDPTDRVRGVLNNFCTK